MHGSVMNAGPLQRETRGRRPRGRRNRGTTLIEVSVSILLAAALGSLAAQVLGFLAYQQHAIERRELAVAEADNLMEQLTSLAWSDLTPERLATFSLSDNLRQAIPAAKLDLAVEPSADTPEARRIRIKIEYPGPAGVAVHPVRLTSWVYRIEPPAAEAKAEQP